MKRGLYVHIPFCVRKCFYCDFFSLPGRLESLDSYIEALLIEARQHQGMSFQTLYMGGGTPSLLGTEGLPKLLEGLCRIFDYSELTESTLEANPDSIDAPLLEAAQISGINRVSIGVQSLSDIELEKVGRIHTANQAVEAVELAREHGYLNISCDVILGLPGQDWFSLMVTLETLIGLGIQHLSLYCLTLEPHTPLALKSPSDLPSDDTQADLYENACSLFAKRGFIHYEISNFALPGYECRHNLNYWRGGEYLGLGPAAASHLQGRRYKNKASLDDYLRDPCALGEEFEALNAKRKASEEAILRLRLLQEGLNLDQLTTRFGEQNVAGLKERLDGLAGKELLERQGSVYRLPAGCALVSNPILSSVMEE
jgi:oxygen-independent coproporphyrinogen III oxidase